ncbi:MAG TPA: PDR/VanB family oxidoreductase [Stellaceae bacterium]|jgi:vanillate O-demethylase ferredoxin subunit|nr:PDR/VanB family oxidoreductase [Stellaceae bacterium]
MQLRVRSITYLADEINGYELVDPNGRDLPRFTAGGHIGVRLGDTVWRDYSLWNDPAERRRYCIAVLRDKAGEASQRLHDTIRVGDLVEVSLPRNHFPLSEEAERHLFLAGGIGITPIMAMIAELKRRRGEFRLHYCTRAAEKTAFRDEFDLLIAQGRVVLHHDGGDPAKGLDIAALLREPQPGTHLYYCGPRGLMETAAAASAHWPPGTVHCEFFSGPGAAPPARLEDDRPFRVRLARSGTEYDVPPGDKIIDVLRRNGVAVRTSCELGYCGACLTRYLAGDPDHRDPILTDKARETHLLICCSRARSPVLELDL